MTYLQYRNTKENCSLVEKWEKCQEEQQRRDPSPSRDRPCHVYAIDQHSKNIKRFSSKRLLLNFDHRFVKICVSEHFVFVKKIHPPIRCDMDWSQ